MAHPKTQRKKELVMSSRLKFMIRATATLFALMGLGAAAGVAGASSARAGMPYRYPEGINDDE
jgi:hypothetical protein